MVVDSLTWFVYYIYMHIPVATPRSHKPSAVTKHEATLGARGGIQVPIEIRKRLNIRPNDKVVFRVTDQEITVEAEPAASLDELYGSVAAKEPVTQDVDMMIQEAKADHRDARYERIMK